MVTTYVKVDKNTNNYQYIHGDFDRDGVPNIDDKKPFDKRNNQRVNKEVSLSETFYYLDSKRREAKKIAKPFAKKHGAMYRIKDNYSIINKTVRRNPHVTNDIIGFRIETDKRSQARSAWERFNVERHLKKQPKIPTKQIVSSEVVGYDNKYLSRGKNLYRAYHSNFLIGNKKGKFGAEFQFRTKKYGSLNDDMHLAYKQKADLNKVFGRRSKQLLRFGY